MLRTFQDGIVETLRKTRIKFAHCFLPQHDAGLIDKIASGSSVSSYVLSHSSVINVPLLRSQVTKDSSVLQYFTVLCRASLIVYFSNFSILSYEDRKFYLLYVSTNKGFRRRCPWQNSDGVFHSFLGTIHCQRVSMIKQQLKTFWWIQKLTIPCIELDLARYVCSELRWIFYLNTL